MRWQHSALRWMQESQSEKRDRPAIRDDGCKSMPSDKGQGIALDDGELSQSPVQVR